MEEIEDVSMERLNEFDIERSHVEEADEIYLSLYHQAGNLGAAFYNVTEGVLYIMNDLADPAPQHKLVFSLLSQIDPKFLLVSSRHNDTIGEQVKQGDQSTNTTSSSLDTSAFASMERNSRISETFNHVEVIVLPSRK